MADPIELTFAAANITAHFANGDRRQLRDVPAAVSLLRALAEARLPVTIDPDADQIARQTADLAGMRLEARDGRLFLLRPGLAPAPLTLPAGAPDLLRPSAASSRPPILIPLAPGLYNDSEAAFREVLARSGKKQPSKRFHNFGTGTFLRGSTAVGRVNTLYRDLLDYGPARIDRKIQDWRQYVESSDDVMDQSFLAWFRAGVDPRDVDTLGHRDRVLPYFRAWVLLRVSEGRF